MQTLFAFLFVLGVLIFVHELGHFVMARRLGVRVLTFSLGFGPKVLKVVRNDTEFCISAIPLGGYVKMAGENPDDPRTGRPDEFLSKTKWERFQVLVAGPAMNIILAVVVMAVILAQGAEVPAYQDQVPVVGVVQPASPAEQVGIRAGDRMLRVAGREVTTWEQFYVAIGTRPRQEVPITFERGGQPITVTVRPTSETKYEVGDIGVLPDVSPVIRSVVTGDPADKAGIKAGDLVYAVEGQRVVFAHHLSDAISKHPGQPIDMAITRNGRTEHIRVTPEKRGDRGIIGIGINDATRTFKPGPLEAIGLSFRRNLEFSGVIFRTLGGLFVGQTSPRQLMGPVAIAQLSGESAQAGWIALFTLLASISLNLGLLNLLPIPVLDGGHIFIMALEGIARRDFSMQVKERMFMAGFFLLMLLMVTVIYNDLTRITWIERLMPWRN